MAGWRAGGGGGAPWLDVRMGGCWGRERGREGERRWRCGDICIVAVVVVGVWVYERIGGGGGCGRMRGLVGDGMAMAFCMICISLFSFSLLARYGSLLRL